MSLINSSSLKSSSLKSPSMDASADVSSDHNVNLLDLLADHDFDELFRRYSSASPYPWISIDNFLKPDFADALAASYPSYEDALKLGGREFKAINETRKTQVVDADKYPEPVLKVHQLFASDAWLELVSKLTGIPRVLADPDMNGGGMHLYASGALLDVHVDFNYVEKKQWHRRLNILLFLNKDWQAEWGGQFEIWNSDVSELGAALEPVFNRCVLFETSEMSYHGVRKVNCPADVTRNSFAAYYYTKEAPQGWDGSTHSTVFIARPDEKIKRVLMPLEKYYKRTTDAARRLVRKVK